MRYKTISRLLRVLTLTALLVGWPIYSASAQAVEGERICLTEEEARKLYQMARMGEGYAEQRKVAMEAEARVNTLAGELHALHVALTSSQGELGLAREHAGEWRQRARLRGGLAWAGSLLGLATGIAVTYALTSSR